MCIRDSLGMEISVIHTLAYKLTDFLMTRDPLSEKVHLGKAGVLGQTLLAVLKASVQRVVGHPNLPASAPRS